MKRQLISLALLCGGSMMTFAAIKPQQIHPNFWWTDMKNPELQIMIYGPDLAKAEASIDYPGVHITRQVALESPNYLFLYLNIDPTAKPGTLQINLKRGKEKTKVAYELKAREKDPLTRSGFSSEDALYLIMPDRFSDGNPDNNDGKGMRFPVKADRSDPNGRHGGDIRGIENNLDYLADLGVTAIWLNPVLENDMPHGSYHGYATTDYYKVDPRFGTNEEYRQLIDKTHAKGMKVVMDMIFNHCGSEHIWFLDRPEHNWFNFPDGYVQTSYRLTPHFDPYTSDYDKKLMQDGWFVREMPDLNQNNEHLMKYLIQNSIYWIEYAGIDGIRMDTYPYAEFEPMAEWCRAVKKEYPNFNIVGESWLEKEGGTAWWQQNSKVNEKNSELQTVMDFPLMSASGRGFKEETDAWSGLNHVYNQLAMDYLYADPMNVMTFLDNHDTDRFLTEAPESLGIYKQAFAFLLTTRGIPQLYYGSETLMHGKKEGSDGYVRLDFVGGFPGDKRSEFTAAGRSAQQNEAFDFLRTMLNWRKGNLAVQKGSLKHFMPTNGVYVYQRKYQDQQVLVIMNGRDSENTIDMSPYAEVLKESKQGKDILTGKTVSLDQKMTLEPRALYILEY